MSDTAALARVQAPVNNARAVFQGRVVVGHLRSIEQGVMFWALLGRGFSDTPTLAAADPNFRVVAAPSTDELRLLQRRLARINMEAVHA